MAWRGRQRIKQGRGAGWRAAPQQRMPAGEELAHPALLEMFPGLSSRSSPELNVVPASGNHPGALFQAGTAA